MNSNLFLCFTLIFVLIKTICTDESGNLPGRIPILMAAPGNPGLFRQSPDLARILPGRVQYFEWNCRFEEDSCNLKSSYHMAQFQRHSDSRSPIFGQSSMLYINVTNAADFPAARLESDYLPTNLQHYACLSLKYLMYGTGARKLFVIQQDIENKCIWADHNDLVDNYGQWRNTQMTINLRDGNPRFFIEAHIDGRPPNYGTIAINTLTVSYGVCQNENTNNCQRSENQPIPPVPSAVK